MMIETIGWALEDGAVESPVADVLDMRCQLGQTLLFVVARAAPFDQILERMGNVMEQSHFP